MIADRRPAGLNRGRQNLLDCLDETIGAAALYRRRQPPGRQPGHEQGFTDIYIAEPGHDALVEQRRFDRRLAPPQNCIQLRLGKPIGKWLRPHRH